MLYEAIKNLHFADNIEALIEKIENVVNENTICGIVRIPTYEVLFASPKLKSMMGEYEGLKCYEYIYKKDKQCEDCHDLKKTHLSSKPLLIQVENGLLDKNFYTLEKVVRLSDNQTVKVNFFYEISKQNYSNENGYVNIDTTKNTHDLQIENVLKDIAKFYDADSAYIYEFSDINNRIKKTFSYKKYYIDTNDLDIEYLPIKKLGRFRDMLLKKGIISFNNFDQLFEKEKTNNRKLLSEDKASHMFISIVVDKSFKGFVGISNIKRNNRSYKRYDLQKLVFGLQDYYSYSTATDNLRQEKQDLKNILSDLRIRMYRFYVKDYTVETMHSKDEKRVYSYDEIVRKYLGGKQLKIIDSLKDSSQDHFYDYVQLKFEGEDFRWHRIDANIEYRDYNNNPLTILVSVMDVHEERTQAIKSENHLRRVYAISESVAEFVVEMNTEGDIIYMNDKGMRILDKNGFVKPNVLEYIHINDRKKILKDIDNAKNNYKEENLFMCQFRLNTHKIGYRDYKFNFFLEKNSEDFSILGVGYDITNEGETDRKIEKELYYDQKTNLFTANYLNKYFSDLDKDKKYCVIFTKIDDLRKINNSFGINVGDDMIAKISAFLTELFVDGGEIFRYWGSKFLIINPIEHHYDIEALNRNLNKKVEIFNSHVFTSFDHQITTVMRMGYSIYPTHSDDFFSLIRSSKFAYSEGRSRLKGYVFRYDNDTYKRQRAFIDIVENVENADLDIEFVPYAQRVVDLENLKSHHYEVLMRWNHPKKGLLNPGYFIKTLEISGLITRVSLVLFKNTVDMFSDLYTKSKEPISFSFNISARDIGDKAYVDNLISIVDRSVLSSEMITFEVTESSTVNSNAEVEENIENLRLRGFSIAIDDFGIEHSSLSKIAKLECDVIKIDKSFIDDMGNKINLLILEMIMKICKEKGYKCIAEGVETENQLRYLKKLGIKNIQGFLFSKPIPLNELDYNKND